MIGELITDEAVHLSANFTPADASDEQLAVVVIT